MHTDDVDIELQRVIHNAEMTAREYVGSEQMSPGISTVSGQYMRTTFAHFTSVFVSR